MDLVWLLALHLGPLHPVEKILTFVLAFGPFVLLGVVIVVRRRAEAAEAADADGDAADRSDAVGDSEPSEAQRER